MANNPSLVATVAAHLYRAPLFDEETGDVFTEDDHVARAVKLAIKVVDEAERQISETEPEWKAIPLTSSV